MNENNKRQGAAFLQGPAALTAGVVLVVLSGIVLATTAWTQFSPLCKTGLVFGFAAVFFAVSALAERLFEIRRTGGALYILGSIFLFLTAVAAGHYGLLGERFLLWPEGFRWRTEPNWSLLLIGGLMSDVVLWVRCRSFRSGIYTGACLAVLTVDAWFFFQLLGLDYPELAGAMAWYAAVLLAAGFLAKRPGRVWPSAGAVPCRLADDSAEEQGVSLTAGGRMPVPGASGAERWRPSVMVPAFAEILLWLCTLALFPQMADGCLEDLFEGPWNRILRENWFCVSAAAVSAVGLELCVWKRGGAVRRNLAQLWIVFTVQYAVILLPCGHVGKLTAAVSVIVLFLLLPQTARLRGTPGSVLTELVLAADALILGLSVEEVLPELPDALVCACCLLPAMLYSRQLGLVWRNVKGIGVLQFLIDLKCLLILTCVTLDGGGLEDVLVLETVCTAMFLLAHIRGSVLWVRVSGVWIVAAALYATRDYWMHFSWWVYLLIAGLSLIGFAAWRELRAGGHD